ncbi:MAG: glutaredoxin 3 [Stenomitos frigidus ULC029]
MANVEIYTWSTCPFCRRAKQLLNQKGVTDTEYDIDDDEAARNAVVARGTNGQRTVPQLFIGDLHVGGSDDLYQLEAQFEANPDQSLPQYGGFCAVAVSEGKLVPSDPETYKVTDGKLYLFYNGEHGNTKPQWEADEATIHANADAQWKKGEFTLP